MKDVSSKTADRSRDISAWRSVQGGRSGRIYKLSNPPTPSSPPGTLGLSTEIREPALQHSLSGDGRNTVEKDRRGWCGTVAFQNGGRVGKLLGDKSTQRQSPSV